MKNHPMNALGCLVAMTLSGCTAGAPATVDDSTVGPGAQVSSWLSRHADLSWSDCPTEAIPDLEGVGAQCGTLTAPIDWSRPDTSDSFVLRFVRASRGGAHDQVLMVNPGGPGGSAAGMALSLALTPAAAPVFETYDVIGIEPRGLTEETDLACDSEAIDDDSEGAVEECSTASPFATHASTTDLVMDHELLRQALKQDEFDFYGVSYGTYVGSVYATLFPDRVGRMILDSVADTASMIRTSDIEGFEESVGRLLEACTSGALGACPFTGDRPEATEQLTALVRTLADRPRRATGPDGEETEVGGRELASYLLTQAYGPRSSWSATVAVLRGVTAGDADALATVASTDDSEVDRALDYAVVCAIPGADDAAGAQSEQQAGTGVLGILEEEDGSPRDCDRWGEYERLDPALSSTGGNRILIVSTLHDPATPLADARRLHETELTNSTLLEVDADGHGALYADSTCATDVANAYLASGALPADPTRCETDH
ncbi:alpha/beta fold hydrolase [Rathayibacter sp. VKM Ac-2760]|uniref:alpha/beta fold hydrolase n=1 Tax=Rathayibacter sp. VKM Ac-2760 TaxID=2609253 RepID=UPI0013160B6E|nr:alpha/beta fold hydrolase [Rathayibacter sp. VKM Ac-2760]QHC59185.1 alpha/beta fold hydrolase [Rathayibacter sp. VKM Ac-2760]